jgi:hypothetical protein
MPAVAAAAIAERRLIDRLLRARAFTPDTSQPLTDLRWLEARVLRRLLGKGVVREHAPGRYYLDGPALADRLAFLRMARAIAFIFVILAAMALAIFGSLSSSRVAL